MITNQKSYSRLRWTTQEQNLLQILKEEQKITSWKKISDAINTAFKKNCRTGKQCRQRYVNFVRFKKIGPIIVKWNKQQDQILFNKFSQYGSKWVKIAHFLPQKSQNCLKNRFYGCIRKVIRKISKIAKQQQLHIPKKLKPQYFVNILQPSQIVQKMNRSEGQQGQSLLKKLRQNIILISTCIQNQQQNYSTCSQLITQIKKLNDYQKKWKNQKNHKRQKNIQDEVEKNQKLNQEPQKLTNIKKQQIQSFKQQKIKNNIQFDNQSETTTKIKKLQNKIIIAPTQTQQNNLLSQNIYVFPYLIYPTLYQNNYYI